MRNKIIGLMLVAGFCAWSFTLPAAGEDKGVIALQQSVSLLMNQLADLQKSFNTQIGLIQGMVSQNTDAVNKLSNALAGLQSAISGAQVIAGQQQSSDAQQFQALNDAISDLKDRLQAMNTTLQQIHQLQQTIPAPAAAPAAAPDGTPGGAPATPGVDGNAAAVAPAPDPGLAVYQNALTDFQNGSAKAQAELAGFIRSYPNDAEVPDATYYLGTIYLQKQEYNEAVDSFSNLIEQYPDDAKAPLAELNKGIALAKRGDKDEAISELRALAKNYPGTEAAQQADIELKALAGTAVKRH